MRGTLKFLLALAASILAMLAFRALVFTVYTVDGSALEPAFEAGDRVVVNRWSYGLRTGGSGLFSYGRICPQSPRKGEFLAVEDSLGRVLVGRCMALPGDTVSQDSLRSVLPSKVNCAAYDCYLLEHVGVVSEERILGRVFLLLYHHRPTAPFWKGYAKNRCLLLR
jgi:signal peptidase I